MEAGASVQMISTRRRRSSEAASPSEGLAYSRYSSIPSCSAKNAPPVSQNSVACTGSSVDPFVNQWMARVQDGLKLKSCFAAAPASTLTFAVWAPSFSCHTSTVYSPGGTPSMVKLPSLSVTAKNGCSSTPT